MDFQGLLPDDRVRRPRRGHGELAPSSSTRPTRDEFLAIQREGALRFSHVTRHTHFRDLHDARSMLPPKIMHPNTPEKVSVARRSKTCSFAVGRGEDACTRSSSSSLNRKAPDTSRLFSMSSSPRHEMQDPTIPAQCASTNLNVASRV